MLKNFERALRADCGVAPGDLLLVGVSGGPDSVCLMHALQVLRQPAIVATFDHKLRPRSADETQAVKHWAGGLGLKFVAGQGDVAAHARLHGQSIEEAARQLRYEFLFSRAREHSAAAVAVGHSADDQAETVLMHLLRGAGLAGLRGMLPRTVLPRLDPSIPVVRPLLTVWRLEILEYCRANALPTLHDPSNDSRDYLRNRVRHDLIPELERFNPAVRQALLRAAGSFAGDLAFVEQHVEQSWPSTVTSQGPRYVAFSAATLGHAHAALQIRLILRAATRLRPDCELGFESLQRARDFIADVALRRLDLGDGLLLVREGATIYVALGEEGLPTEMWPQYSSATTALADALPARVDLDGGWHFSLDFGECGPDAQALAAQSGDRYRTALDADALPAGLELRTPRPGDRIASFGMHGHTHKLSDLFVNAGLPQRLRRRWPVLAAGNAVIWIPGFRTADAQRIRPGSKRSAMFTVARDD